MKDFPKELKIQIAEAHNGYCAHEKCHRKVHSIHHRVPNTKANQKLFPLFLQSPFNAVPLCEYCHREFAHFYKISYKVAELFEQWLNWKILNTPLNKLKIDD